MFTLYNYYNKYSAFKIELTEDYKCIHDENRAFNAGHDIVVAAVKRPFKQILVNAGIEDVEKKLVPRHNGDWFIVSPWALTWDDENYYLVAFDDEEKKIKHYRVDKMLRISITNEKREGRDSYRGIDMADYTKKTFGMFGGEERTVTIECENQFAGVMIDRFGKDVSMVKRDENHFAISPKVAVSPQFIGWIIGLGDGVKVTGPEDVVKTIKETFAAGYKMYK